MKKKQTRPSRARGDAFVGEPTGSAPLINLDGRWEHDFTNHVEEKTGK
ncbi:hypothetical protein IT084_10070 [Desulfallas sp. Bu1-1]|nr:hypothetical protein [Desulfallas sp. Bu1-1]MBF7083320.1 hypothetical protein [Desulfallas sp. Bu1-1]